MINSRDENYDIVVIGGGAVGSYIALDATLRGYKILLLEKDDFGSKASSKSSKLVHGGVRYLEKAIKEFDKSQYNLVLEGLESELLNNKVVSSKDKFIYKFTYLVKKENKEFLCTANEVEINRIQDNFVFKNFLNLKEECIEK